jgi:hypothetical protein
MSLLDWFIDHAAYGTRGARQSKGGWKQAVCATRNLGPRPYIWRAISCRGVTPSLGRLGARSKRLGARTHSAGKKVALGAIARISVVPLI